VVFNAKFGSPSQIYLTYQRSDLAARSFPVILSFKCAIPLDFKRSLNAVLEADFSEIMLIWSFISLCVNEVIDVKMRTKQRATFSSGPI
jgi:hypothetical protein